MKVIIASDIHGVIEYAKQLEKFIEQKSPDKIILLGDLLNNYDPLPVSNILNRFAGITEAVRGNNDSSMTEQLLIFSITSIHKELELDGIKYIITHGHLLPYLYDQIKNTYHITGHTHMYQLEGLNINPGSVGLPRKNKEHTCLYYENKTFYLIDLDTFNVIGTKIIQ
jgi:putative phosphoesterase